MSWNFFLFQLMNGISFGALLFFLASGFTLIFGLLRIVNLAHGALYLLGAYIGLTVLAATGSFALALIAAPLVVGLFGLVAERGLLRRVRGRELPEVLLTVGLIFIITDMVLAIWGGDPTSISAPAWLSGPMSLGFMSFPRFRIFVVVLAILMGTLLFLLHHKTRVGAMVRAGVDDRETVAALGINIDRVFSGVFVLGAVMAGLAGVIGGTLLSLVPGISDLDILLFGLVVVIIGGLGSLPGAVVGSILVGLIDSFGTALVPDIAYFTLFLPMLLVLVFRPSGLLGKGEL